MLSYVKPMPYASMPSDTITEEASKPSTPDCLYHVLLVTSQLSHNPNNTVENLRVTGTYGTPKSANAAAKLVVYAGGHEVEMFKTYLVDHDKLEKEMAESREASDGLVVHATAQDGTDVKVYIHVTPNNQKLTVDEDHGRVTRDLFYIVQTQLSYDGDNIKLRSHNVEGVYTDYREARKGALTTLLDEKDGITKDSFAAWEEAGENESDCGYGENVVVHAVGQNGDNFSVSVLKGEVLESVRLSEAAMRMR